MIFGDNASEGTAVVAEQDKPDFVYDDRTKPEGGPGTEEVTKTEEQLELERQQAEENAGKTPEQIAEDKRLAEIAAAAGTKTPEQIAEEAKQAEEAQKQADEVKRIKDEARAELFKTFGVASEEELQAKLHPTKPKTEEELKQETEIYNADLANYAIKNKVFNNDEWLAYHNIQKMPNDQLVYNEFANSYKQANVDRKDADGKADPVTDDELKDKFNELYQVDSENPTLKEQGQKNIDIKANALKAPLEQKYNDVKEIYDSEISEKKAIPGFRSFFQDVFAKAVPMNLEYGEGDNKVVYDLSGIDRAELEQYFVKEIGPRELSDFMKGKGTPEQRERITKEITKEILYRTDKDRFQKAIDAGISRGKATAKVGSHVPFVEPGKGEVRQQSVKTLTKEDTNKVASDFARI